jgi:hypothetical protein
MSMLRLASTVVLTGLLPWACVDPPITVILPLEAGIRAPPDSSVEGGFDLTACRSCVAAPDMPGPGCGSAYSACEGDSKCKAMIACAFESGCVGGPSLAFIGCAFPCAEDAGALASNDPALPLAAGLFQCLVNGACMATCLTK